MSEDESSDFNIDSDGVADEDLAGLVVDDDDDDV